MFHARPGEAIAQRARDAGWRRIGVYGLDYVMTVRDYTALDGLELVPFDVEFDLARAVKSEAELDSVRDSVRINRRGLRDLGRALRTRQDGGGGDGTGRGVVRGARAAAV